MFKVKKGSTPFDFYYKLKFETFTLMTNETASNDRHETFSTENYTLNKKAGKSNWYFLNELYNFAQGHLTGNNSIIF